MLEESDRAWDKIASRSYAFNALRDECTHLRMVSLQQVRFLRCVGKETFGVAYAVCWEWCDRVHACALS